MTLGILLRKKNWILHPRYGAFIREWLCKISDLKVIFSDRKKLLFQPIHSLLS